MMNDNAVFDDKLSLSCSNFISTPNSAPFHTLFIHLISYRYCISMHSSNLYFMWNITVAVKDSGNLISFSTRVRKSHYSDNLGPVL